MYVDDAQQALLLSSVDCIGRCRRLVGEVELSRQTLDGSSSQCSLDIISTCLAWHPNGM